MDTGRIVEPIKRNIKVKYPWKSWVDGRTYEVVQGVHYQCDQGSFLAGLYAHANNHGMKVTTQRRGPDKVRFQFIKG